MNLAQRSQSPELMDNAYLDFEDYRNCLQDLARVNLVTMAYGPVLAWLSKVHSAFSLLDVGCGYGDMLRRIRKRHPQAALTGIDRNPWAIQAARAATPESAKIRYEAIDVFRYEPQQPDYIISTQFVHHLSDLEAIAFVTWMERHAARGWFINDLHRHWCAYYGFRPLASAARWHRFVRHDGRVSIARSFRPTEWRDLLGSAGIAPGAARVSWFLPFRLCVARTR